MENENEVLVEETTEEETPEEVEESEEESKDEIDWEARALKAEETIIESKKKAKANKPIKTKATESPDDELRKTVAELAQRDKMDDFRDEHNLSRAEVREVFKHDPNPTAETLESPFVKGGLTAVKTQEKVDNNTPASSAKSATLDRKAMKDMSPEDKEVKYSKYLKSKGIDQK